MNDIFQRYFEGEMGEEEERSFFAQLSADTGMRRDFDFYLSLSKVKNDIVDAISVPEEAETALFGQLGYSSRIPSEAGFFAQNRAKLAATAAAGLLLLAVWYFRPAGTEQGFSAAKDPVGMPDRKEFAGSREAAGQLIQGLLGKTGSKGYKTGNGDYDNEATRMPRAPKTSSGGSLPTAALSAGAAHAAPGTENSPGTIVPEIEQSAYIPRWPGNALSWPGSMPLPAGSYPQAMNDLSSLRIEVQGLVQLWSYPAVKIPSNSSVRNLQLSVLYGYYPGLYDSRFSLGLELGYESYTQEYRDMVESGEATVRQNPSLSSLSVFGRYYIAPSESFLPYIQAGAGLTQLGGLVKAGIGLEYNILPSAYISGAGELSGLSYSAGNKNYSSIKAGGKIGIGYRF